MIATTDCIIQRTNDVRGALFCERNTLVFASFVLKELASTRHVAVAHKKPTIVSLLADFHKVADYQAFLSTRKKIEIASKIFAGSMTSRWKIRLSFLFWYCLYVWFWISRSHAHFAVRARRKKDINVKSWEEKCCSGAGAAASLISCSASLLEVEVARRGGQPQAAKPRKAAFKLATSLPVIYRPDSLFIWGIQY